MSYKILLEMFEFPVRMKKKNLGNSINFQAHSIGCQNHIQRINLLLHLMHSTYTNFLHCIFYGLSKLWIYIKKIIYEKWYIKSACILKYIICHDIILKRTCIYSVINSVCAEYQIDTSNMTYNASKMHLQGILCVSWCFNQF